LLFAFWGDTTGALLLCSLLIEKIPQEKSFSRVGRRSGVAWGVKKRKTFLRKGIDKCDGVCYNTEEKEVELPFSPDRR
jgi:hypothetical protein